MPSATYSQPCKCKVNHAQRQQQAHAALEKRAKTPKKPSPRPCSMHFQPNEAPTPTPNRPFPFTSLPYDIRHNIYRILFVSPQDIVVKDYSAIGLWRRRYTVEPGTELLHRSYSNDAIWKEASEIYYGENTFVMTKITMSYFLMATATFPYEIHRPRELIRNIKLTAGCLSESSFETAVRQVDILRECPRLKNVTLEYWAILIPYHPRCPLSKLFLTGRLATIVGALRKLKAHVSKNMILIASDSDTIPVQTNYVGDDRIDMKEDLSWLLDIPSEKIKEKVANGQGSLRECLAVEMATKWAPPLIEDQAKWVLGDSPPGEKSLTRAIPSTAPETSPHR